MKKPSKKRTARFDITFTVEVEVAEPLGRKDWQVSDAACDVENAVTAMVDTVRGDFKHEGVTIVDRVGFGATFIEEVQPDEA